MVAATILGPLFSTCKGPVVVKAAGAAALSAWGAFGHAMHDHTTADHHQDADHGGHEVHDHEDHGHEDHDHEDHDHEDHEDNEEHEEHDEGEEHEEGGTEEPEDAEELEMAVRSSPVSGAEADTNIGRPRKAQGGGQPSAETILLAVAAAAAAASATSRLVEGRCKDLGVVPWAFGVYCPTELRRRRALGLGQGVTPQERQLLSAAF
mmetsp:Transcript_11904/g.23097  ORF Transcript_11904/g.23097 Transcript_11904/m.23097 type:complete len:207 (-) Transcript_11904:49-669(-)|eukprot:CAMPEP_0172725308 /NCGR_PEP_ID=MMETSP1074-20121228/88090_1 /TAXON_ID=2916 /ORGANISM="Ceratium fusus, Strain PA161109" /LENGTH=206 /DNA_ID=CAMNT_0013552041 /DNA_START=67 /DNA_END=687 /DNA_ORIENTATION=+